MAPIRRDFGLVRFLEQGVDLVAILSDRIIHLRVGDRVVERLRDGPLANLSVCSFHVSGYAMLAPVATFSLPRSAALTAQGRRTVFSMRCHRNSKACGHGHGSARPDPLAYV
jgi:hypothetical protein